MAFLNPINHKNNMLYALENNARAILTQWQEDVEKHVGRIGMDKQTV